TRDADRYIAYCLIDLAAINGHFKIVEMLMNVNSPQITLSALGLVVNQIADRRMLDLLLPQFTKEEIITANVMREAIARHDLWLIKKLLALNIPIPAAALHILAENPLDHFPFYRLVVDFLIDEVGVDVNQLDQYQMTPLHRAKNSTDLYLVNKLLRHPSIDLSKKDFLGETPVLKMIKMKSLRLFSIFLKKRKYDTSDTNHEGKNLLLITVTEITKYLDGFTQLKNNYTQIESFLDKAPFSIVYVNHSNHLVGLNATFSQWISLDKERALGQPLKEFIDGNILSGENDKISVVTIKPNRHPSFKALWFPPIKGSKLQAALLCRLDSETLALQSSDNEDYLKQATFSHAPIPAVMIEESGKIVAFNPSFA
ncbi:ankyrin repeat domain-containing protein, partial [bacterium]|nr:ankyrin repeat domain-containing protein [bacterium]